MLMRWFRAFLPREERFFDLFARHSEAVVQGALTGAGATYLFARTVVLLGAGRAVLFPSLVPPFTLLVGFLALGEVPSVSQLIGLVVVVVGFQLTQKG